MPLSKDIPDLTPKTNREIRDLTIMSDSDINTDDIPELTDWKDAKRGLFFLNPRKKRLTP